jgi:hypothetical protein
VKQATPARATAKTTPSVAFVEVVTTRADLRAEQD